ncbi:MAG: Gram-negative bacterial TonB protein C-terminal [Pseudomonadota bacterium]|jgi:TonB family protein
MSSRPFAPLWVALTVLLLTPFSTQSAEESLPRLPFPMPAAEYPQEALVANQEGAVVLRATIGLDAKMTNVSVVETSGHPILDDAAVLVLRNAQLSQPPMTPDGQPTSADVLVDATWTLPLESAAEYFPTEFYGTAPYADASAITYPKEDTSSPLPITARDYPAVSIRREEGGIAGAYVLIAIDGAVKDVRLVSSSGHERLDEATLVVLRRFDYVPWTTSVAPTELWIPVRLMWSTGSWYETRRVNPCYSVPLVDPYRRRDIERDEDAPPLDRWMLYRRDGRAEAALVLTDQGWRKLGPPLLDALNAQPGPSMDDNRPETCWIYHGSMTDQIMIVGTLY